MMTRRRWLFLASFTLLLGGGTALLASHRASASSPPSAYEATYNLQLTQSDGQPLALSTFKGKPLILNFWATWCPPCLMEIPNFSSFAQEHPEVQVVGVAVNSGAPADMPKLREQMGLSYPIYTASQSFLAAFGVRGLPTTVVLDPDGHVVARHVGAMSMEQIQEAAARAQ